MRREKIEFIHTEIEKERKSERNIVIETLFQTKTKMIHWNTEKKTLKNFLHFFLFWHICIARWTKCTFFFSETYIHAMNVHFLLTRKSVMKNTRGNLTKREIVQSFYCGLVVPYVSMCMCARMNVAFKTQQREQNVIKFVCYKSKVSSCVSQDRESMSVLSALHHFCKV